MFTITKEFRFEAAHSLPQMPDGHQCKRPHGHSYVVELELSAAERDPATGFVLDYGLLEPFERAVKERYDHRDLNVVLGDGTMTTAERLAYHFYVVALDVLDPALRASRANAFVSAVTVRETAKTRATYRPAYPVDVAARGGQP